MRKVPVLLALLFLVRVPCHGVCQSLWVDLSGYGYAEMLSPEPRPLADYVLNIPSWWPWPAEAARKDILQWTPIDLPGSLPEVVFLGSFEGVAFYDVEYGPTGRVVVAGRKSDWTFCPVLIIAGSSEIVSGIDPTRHFVEDGYDLFATRVYISGMGVLQESYFVALLQGQPTPMEMDMGELTTYARENDLELYHRDGGFCQDQLAWENWAWRKDCAPAECETKLRVEFRIDGTSLRAERFLLLPRLEDTDCVQYPSPHRASSGP